MVSQHNRRTSLRQFLHLRWDTSTSASEDSDSSIEEDSSSRSSQESDESFPDSLEKDDGTVTELTHTSEPQTTYYDEFSASANLSALSVTFEDATVLDEDPFAADPFAATPPASPISPRTPPVPITSSTASTPAQTSPFLATDPYASPQLSPNRFSAPPAPRHTSHNQLSPISTASPENGTQLIPRIAPALRPLQQCFSVPRSPTSAVARHSPLSPVKSAFPVSAAPSDEVPLPLQSRRRLRSSPQQPSIDMLSVFVMKAPPRRRPRGTVGANLPLEPWDCDGPDLSPIPNETLPVPKSPKKHGFLCTVRERHFHNTSQSKISLRHTPSVDSLNDAAPEHTSPYHYVTLSRSQTHGRNKTMWDITKF